MGTMKEYEKLNLEERRNRQFSEDFKRKKISELDRNLVTISELCREYSRRPGVARHLSRVSAGLPAEASRLAVAAAGV